MLGLNPWAILIAVVAFVLWSGTITTVAYKKGYDAKTAEYNAAALEQIQTEQEAADKVSKERQKTRQDINRSEREIRNEANKHADGPASDRLRAISRGLHERWRKDHQ